MGLEVQQGASRHSRCGGRSRHPLRGLNRIPGPEQPMDVSGHRLQCEFKLRVSELAEQHPPISRHPINDEEKVKDDIVEGTWTVFPQLFNNRFFERQHGVGPRVEVQCAWCSASCTEL